MIEEQGRVVALKGKSVWVETIRQSSCGNCSAKVGCGHSVLAKLGDRTVHMQARSNIDVDIGDEVIVGVSESVLVKSSILAYLVPLLLMLLSALISDALWANEPVTMVSGLAGLAVGFVLLHWHFKVHLHDERYQPVILRHSLISCFQSGN